MIRLSKLSDYAIVALCELARLPMGSAASACVLAQRTGVPEPTVAKLMKALARDGILASHRGITGGYSLSRPAAAISVADVIAALEGPIALTDCVDGHEGGCATEGSCQVRGNWNKINDAIKSALAAVSLADMAQPSYVPALSAADIGLEQVDA